MIMLGSNIKKYREASNLTQEQLAQRLNISPQAVSKWERGENMPDCASLSDLADALGVSLDRLFGRENASFEDVGYQIVRYMRYMPLKEKLKAIKKTAYFCEQVMMRDDANDSHWQKYYEKREWDLGRMAHSVSDENEYGFTFASNRAELPFYSVFIEPDNGWKAILKPEDYDMFFEIMSDPEVRKAIFVLFTKPDGIKFDAAYASMELGIDEPTPILQKLEKLRLFWRENINIDGKETVIWTFHARCGFIALFSLLNELLFRNTNFDMQSNDRKEPYLR